MDVADFFQFQTAFQADCIINATANEEHIVCIGIFRSKQAAERYEILIEQMSQRESISEKLKEENQMEWVRRMRNLENRAEEIVKAELIYTFERR